MDSVGREGVANRSSVLGSSAFVGRERELDAIGRVLADVQTGVGRLVLAHGGAGIGKTSLIDATGRAAAECRAPMFVGRCQEVEGAPPFWPWIQVLRSVVRTVDVAQLATELGTAASSVVGLVPELARHALPAPATDPVVARFLVFEGVTALLRWVVRDRAVVIALDDLHRADVPSLRLLEFLLPHLRELPVMVLAAFRDTPHDLEPLATTLSMAHREPEAVWLPLGGLSQAAVGVLLSRVAGRTLDAPTIRAVHERTGGNPLFVTALARRLEEFEPRDVGDGLATLPPEMRATIARHVDEASRPCVAALTGAAVLGREFRVDVLAHLMAATPDAVASLLVEAARRGLIGPVVDDARRMRFTHVLTRDALYEGIPAPDRPVLHRRAGEALEAVMGSDPPLVDLALHFAHAGDARAIRYARAAGDAAYHLHAFEAAIEQYELAVQAAERIAPVDPALQCDLLLSLAEAQRGGGGIEASKATVLRVLASSRACGDGELFGRAALVYGPDFDYGEGAVVDPVHVGILTEAIERLGEGDHPLLVRLLGKVALARYWDVAAAPAREAVSARAVAMARRLGDSDALVAALSARHIATWTPDNLAERRAIASEALSLLGPTTDARLVFQAHWLRAADHLEANEMTMADAEIAACARVAELSRHPHHAFVVAGLHAVRATMRGDFAAGADLAAHAVELGRRWFPEFARFAELTLAICSARTASEWAAFEGPLRAAAQAHPGAPTFHALLGVVLCELGRFDEARAALRTLASRGLTAIPRDLNMLVGLSFAADVAVAVHDDEAVAVLYALLVPYERSNALLAAAFIWRGSIAHRLATMAGVLGRRDAAAAHFEVALARHADGGALPWLAATQYEYARFLLAGDASAEHDRASALIAEARGTCERLGLEQLAMRLAGLDGGPPAPSGATAEVSEFRREGQSWVISYAGKAVRMRGTRGFEYLAMLLQAPYREIHVTTLVGGVPRRPPSAARSADDRKAGTLRDARTHAVYRLRLQRIAEEVDEAERTGDVGRLARAREERQAIVEELSAADQGRRASSHAERARIAVAKGLSRAYDRLRPLHPALVKHLEATIRRGYVCAYVPDPRMPIRWEG